MKRLVLVIPMILGLACSVFRDPVAKFINAKVPPINVDQQRQTAIVSTAGALSQLTAPNVAFGVPIADLEKVLNSDELKKLGVTSVNLAGDNGLLRVDVAFTRKFTEAGEDASPEVQKLIAKLTPEVTGKTTVFAGIASATTEGEANTSELHLRLLPVFRSLEVDKVTIAGKFDATVVGEALFAIVNHFADNVTGALARSPLTDLKVPAAISDQFNASRTIRISDDAGNAQVTVEANPIGSPVRLLGIATLVTDKQVSAIAQFVATGAANPAPGPVVQPNFSAVKSAFEGVVQSSLDVPTTPAGPWFAIRKDLIASVVNTVLGQAGLCVSASGESSEQQLRKEITFPDSSTIDCTPDRPCDFPPQHDTRNCEICLIPNIFTGGCSQRGNDPICEAAKATQNKLYEAEALGKKLDCERIKTQDKVKCEAGKEFIKQLGQTGKFGIIEAGVRARTNGLRVCLRSFNFTPTLNHVRAEMDIQGDATADVSMKFIPLDIIGHLACQAPFTENRTFQAALQKSEVTIESDIALTTDADGANAVFTVQENTIPVQLKPGPTEFLLTSPNLTLACQGLNLIKPLAVVLTPFIPQLRGSIDQKVPQKEVSVRLAVPTQTVGGFTIKGAANATGKALVLISQVTTN